MLIIAGFSLGLLLVPIGSLYTDVQNAVSLGIGFLMYTAPIVYPPPTEGLIAKLIYWNPLTPLVMLSRDWITSGSFDFALPATMIALLALGLAFFAAIILRVVMPHLVVRMGM
jgi:lipopolysaccharide transport system permease protein